MTISRPQGEEIVRVPMPWEDYLLTDDGPYEYYGGHCVVSPPASMRHAGIARRLDHAVTASLPAGLTLTRDAGWSPPDVRELLSPDLMVHPPAEDLLWLEEPPALVVEILSSNRRDDLVAKVQRYAAWGAPDYWIVDPRDRVILTMRNDAGIFVETGRFTGGRVTLRYGDHAVEVDVDELLGPS